MSQSTTALITQAQKLQLGFRATGNHAAWSALETFIVALRFEEDAKRRREEAWAEYCRIVGYPSETQT